MMVAIAAWTDRFWRAVIEKQAPARRAAATTAWE